MIQSDGSRVGGAVPSAPRNALPHELLGRGEPGAPGHEAHLTRPFPHVTGCARQLKLQAARTYLANAVHGSTTARNGDEIAS